jgi:prophage regulatory protein
MGRPLKGGSLALSGAGARLLSAKRWALHEEGTMTSLKPRDVRARHYVPPEKKILRLLDVLTLTTLSRTTVLRLMAEGEFPSPFRIGKRALAWHRADVERFLAGRPARQSSPRPSDAKAVGE